MKKLFLFLCSVVWLSALYAGGEAKTVLGCCNLIMQDKEYAATVASFGCGGLSIAGCGAYTGSMLIHNGVLMSGAVMVGGSTVACVGVSGAIACCLCGNHYAQKSCEPIVQQPVPLKMVYKQDYDSSESQ